MANFSLYLVLIISAIKLANSNEPDGNIVNNGIGEDKLLRLQEYAHNLAVLLRNLEVNTPICKIKLTNMANELVYKTQSVVYQVNQAIPTVKSKSIQDSVAEVENDLSEIADEIQHHLHGKPEKLKECLADNIDKSIGTMSKKLKILQNSESKNETFVVKLLKKGINEGILAYIKLKLQTEFFHKTNKELETEIDAGLEAFCTSLQNVKNDDPNAKEELIDLIHSLERVEEFAVIKLENYVLINGIDDKNLATTKEISKGLSASCDSFHQLTTGNHEVSHLKTEFEKLFRVAIGLIKKVAQCEVAEDTVGGMYIRSILFDGITLSKVYEHELKALNKIQGFTKTAV